MTVTPRTRHFTASALVLDYHRMRTLLVRHNMTGMWQFPGGHVDPDEDGGECAIREVAEETGLTIRLAVPGEETGYGHLLAVPLQVAEHPAPAKPDKGEPAHRHLDMLYLATAVGGEVTPQLDEVSGARWWSIDELLAPQRPAGVRSDVPVAVLAALRAVQGG